MTAEFVCMYCQQARCVECMDRACTCCFGKPAEIPTTPVAICTSTYYRARDFADQRRWPRHSWFVASSGALRGRRVERVVHLDCDRNRYVAEVHDALRIAMHKFGSVETAMPPHAEPSATPL